MLYKYLITMYKVIAGLVTPERLIAVALGVLGLYVVWMFFSLITSWQRKFNSRCQELITLIVKTPDIEKNPDFINKKAERISSGFGFGWKKFKTADVGKPSDYITRREALDVEVNGGLLNNGKTMMRAYITFFTSLLFIFNFAYVGGEETLNFRTVAEAMVLPFVFYVVIKLFYFLHNSIKQKLYKMDIESYYELIDLLDLKFAKKARIVVAEGEEEIVEEETNDEPELTEEESEPEEEENGLDKYDIFKKKNIDVDKLLSETPSTGATLPFINVDSDYVIKDDEQVGAKKVGQEDNASTLFGGMMQNTSGLKKTNFVDVEKSIAQIDEEKLENLNKFEELEFNEPTEKVNTENEEVEKTDDTPSIEPEVSVEEKEVEKEDEKVESEDKIDLETGSSNTNKFIEIEKNDNAIVIDNAVDEANIASVVSGFKASRSKLSSGGMVIERNEPISKRERPTYSAEPQETLVEEEINPRYDEPVRTIPEQVTINRPTTTENTDMVLNTLKSAPGNYDAYNSSQNFAPSTTYGSVYDQNYGYGGQSMYQTPAGMPMSGYGYTQEPVYSNYNQVNYNSGFQPVTPQASYNYAEEEFEEEEEVQPAKKKKVVRTKENEPRPRNLKSKVKKEEKSVKEEDSSMAKRGRPKKQEVSETMVIENDKQFDEVLSRAEKLMRKSESGLSESQSKRIEKEIKMLMDAMNRYKESK